MPLRSALLLPFLLSGLAGCGSVASPTASKMTYASMQAINPGVDGDWILSEYPFARNIKRRRDGSLLSLGYWIEDPQGQTRPLMLHFDAENILVRKQYGGPNVRPPEQNSGGLKVGGP